MWYSKQLLLICILHETTENPCVTGSTPA